jgi:DNA-binding CsgD family transcriptional regulator
MSSSPQSDLFVNAVEAIYVAAPDPSRWPIALQAIADCFGDVGTIIQWQRNDGSFSVIVSPMLEAALKDYVENGWNRRDLPAIRAVERGLWLRRDAMTDRHAVSDIEIATDPFYTEFLARHGLGRIGTVAVSPNPHVGMAISVQRNARERPPFSDAELTILLRLGRHAENSFRLSTRLLDAELVKIGLGEALNRLSIGVFALDSLGRVVFSNSAGDRLLDDSMTLLHDRLLIGSAPERAALEAAIEQMTSTAPDDVTREPKPILIHRQKAERPLAIYALPIAMASHPAAQFLTNARAIVLAIDPEVGGPLDPTILRDLLGLTLGEARVAALVGTGLSPRETAEKLGIAEESARTTLKRVFSKVGVSRQSELAALLTKLVLR